MIANNHEVGAQRAVPLRNFQIGFDVVSFSEELDAVRASGLYRSLRKVENVSGVRVTVDGRPAILFCSNDYLNLSSHPRVKEAAIAAVEKWGTGACASRLVSGNIGLYDELEAKLALLKGAEAALVFGSGYLANLGVLTSVVGEGDLILSDELNHASIIDACRLSRAQVKVFRHNDAAHVGEILDRSAGYKRKILVTESVFSMDGDAAPLLELCEVAKQRGCMVMVDEAHATGLFGHRGAGMVEQMELSDRVDIVMGTLGKALGCYGAYVAGSYVLRELLVNRARTIIYSTALPAPVLAAAGAAVDLLSAEAWRRDIVRENAGLLRDSLRGNGFDIGHSRSQIVPVILGEAEEAVTLSEALLERGIYATAIRPPSVPQGQSRIRFTVTAGHSKEDVRCLVETLAEIRYRRQE